MIGRARGKTRIGIKEGQVKPVSVHLTVFVGAVHRIKFKAAGAKARDDVIRSRAGVDRHRWPAEAKVNPDNLARPQAAAKRQNGNQDDTLGHGTTPWALAPHRGATAAVPQGIPTSPQTGFTFHRAGGRKARGKGLKTPG